MSFLSQKSGSYAVYFGDWVCQLYCWMALSHMLSLLRLAVGCWCMLGCPWCELLFMWPEDCLMCRCDGVRDHCWKESLCSAARSPYTDTSCFRPLSSQAAQCTHLASEKKKVKTEGFSTPGSAAQDPIHLPSLLQDDFIFQIHKYFPVKAPEVQEQACAWLSSVSDLRPLRHRLAPQCACYKNPVMRVMCSVSHCEGSWRNYEGLSRCRLSQQSGYLNQVTPGLVVFWGEWVVTKKWGW